MELTALLVAIDRTELSQTLGQVTIGVRAKSLEDLTVVRAVHWLEHELFALLWRGDGTEGVRTVLSPVTRGDIELLRADMWGDDLLIAELLLDLLEEVLQTQAKLRTTRQPQGKARADILREGEEAKLLTDLAVVTLLCFFEEGQILIEHLFLREGNPVEARQLLARLIATPVGTSDTQQLDGLDVARVWHVWTTAQVREVPLRIGRDRPIGEVCNKL